MGYNEGFMPITYLFYAIKVQQTSLGYGFVFCPEILQLA